MVKPSTTDLEITRINFVYMFPKVRLHTQSYFLCVRIENDGSNKYMYMLHTKTFSIKKMRRHLNCKLSTLQDLNSVLIKRISVSLEAILKGTNMLSKKITQPTGHPSKSDQLIVTLYCISILCTQSADAKAFRGTTCTRGHMLNIVC